MFSYFLHHVLRLPLTMRVRYDRRPRKGHPTKLNVVFLHGIASSYEAWRKVLPVLSSDPDLRNTRLIALDLIGFGKSEKPRWFDYDFKHYRRSLEHTLKKIKVRGPIVFAGHSMGCLIASDFAAHNQHFSVPALLLVSPPFLRPADLRRLPDKFYISAYGKLRDHTDSAVVGTLASFISRVTNFDKRTLNTVAFQRCMDHIILNPQAWHTVLGLDRPIRIIHGRVDPLVVTANLRYLAEHESNIELIETFGGHDIAGAKLNKVIKNTRELILQYQNQTVL